MFFFILVFPGKLSQDSENEQNSVSLEVLLIKVCHKKRKVCWYRHCWCEHFYDLVFNLILEVLFPVFFALRHT